MKRIFCSLLTLACLLLPTAVFAEETETTTLGIASIAADNEVAADGSYISTYGLFVNYMEDAKIKIDSITRDTGGNYIVNYSIYDGYGTKITDVISGTTSVITSRNGRFTENQILAIQQKGIRVYGADGKLISIEKIQNGADGYAYTLDGQYLGYFSSLTPGKAIVK
ncbi:hypothetical protein D7X25_27685 [bacterium 1XD42-8]|jgi:hypothetical protein|nr:hypothetical protein [Lachnospiraceae bacterium]RKJ42310.1 hypothetical protein D7X25_27685 [bacterium 1XD42-8]